MTLIEQLAAVQRYAEYLEGLGGHAFPQRDKMAQALRREALQVLHVAGAWPVIRHTGQGVLRQAPTGQQVLHRTTRVSERLELLEGARRAARGVSEHEG
jgi:hypothetical protein